MTKFSSPVEVGARLTSNFSPARKLFGVVRSHAGTDWAPKKSGDTGSPVYAVADGIVSGAGVGILAGHSGNIIVIDHGILRDSNGSDRTLTNYGHLSKILVDRGDRVVAGQLIGRQGATGNVTGVHLHLGVRFNGKFADPAKWLKNKGITPGKTAPVSTIIPTAPKPPVVKPSNPPAANNTTKVVQARLKAMGYDIVVDGVNGSATKGIIKKYQSSQAHPYKLVADGNWGSTTEAHFQWTLGFQKKINGWKSTLKKLNPDGHYGANTVARVRDIQKRNQDKAYKGVVDGVPGRVFCKMLGIGAHP